MRDLFVTRPDSSELAVGRQESIYADIFPFVRASRGFWLSGLGLFALQFALQFVSVPITIFFYGFSALDLANSAFDLASIFLNSLFAFLSYVLAVLASRMSWGFGIALLAIGVPYALFIAGAGVLLSMSFWDEPVFIGGFLIGWMCGIFFSIWMLKAGYRYVVSDNFIRMLVADSQEKRLFSLSSLSTSLGIPFSIEHIRHQRSKILMYFIISNLLYAGFTTILIFSPLLLSVSLLFISVGRFFAVGTIGAEAAETVKGLQVTGAIIFGVSVVIAVLCLAGGALIRNVARRAARISVLELQKLDARAPVLFLRPFRDDQVYLVPPPLSLFGYFYELGRRDSNLDVLVLEEGTDSGPVLALGNPNDPVPPYGAARGYFDHETWQESFGRLAQVSSAIVICLDDTDGIWWEVDYIAANNMLQKTLFLIHPRNSAPAANKNLLRKVAERLALSDDLKEKLLSRVTHAKSPQGGVIGFFIDRHHALKVARSPTFSRVAFLMIVRWFVRTRLDARVEKKLASQVPANFNPPPRHRPTGPATRALT